MGDFNGHSDAMIRMRGVRVDYADVTAVRNLDLDIPAGEVFGLIGPNGAGKSSTIRVLATLQEPTYGRVWIRGIDTAEHPARARQILGYMPDMAPVYEDLKCWEFLDHFGAAYFVSRHERQRRVDECIEAVGLEQKRDVMAGTLSRGMTQRLVLAKTILPDPQVLLLDEPASGLDPIARIQMRDLLRRLAGEGKTILVSSHILSELSAMCTSVGIMQRGEMLLSGSIDDVVQRMRSTMRIAVRLHGHVNDAIDRLGAYDHVESVDHDAEGYTLHYSGDEADAVRLLASMIRDGLPVCGFNENKFDMEDILLESGARDSS